VDYALRLFDRGIVCLPLRAGGRHLDIKAMGYHPVHLETRRKELKELAFTSICFHLALKPPDRSVVEKWFSGGANIGILGGADQLVILDFDEPGVYAAWRLKHRSIADVTPVARSPGGYHVFVRCMRPLVSSSMHVGLRRAGHIKSLGGYVVASPSALKAGGRYEWMPGRSLEDIEPPTVADISKLSIRPVSPVKHAYDHLLGRGFFTDR